MTYNDIESTESVASEIEQWVDEATELSRSLGLDPYDVKYWIVDHEEMNELAAYGGFQERYPHWRWGMKYERQKKQSQYTGSRIFELVNNDDPAHAFLQRSNNEADQKAVVTHVEAHSDFFKNNRWFSDSPNASHHLARHADRIESIMRRPDVDRSDVESLIDTMLCIEDTIDQHQHEFTDDEDTGVEDHVDSMEVGDEIKEYLFDDEWVDEVEDEEVLSFHDDVMEYIIENGMRYDEDEGRAVEFEDWELEVMNIIRDEAYYFAPQKMTKTTNEGWASFWETIMMADEGFAGDDEFVTYADHHSKVLSAPGFNPYELGREIWEYIENTTNRREVLDKLLRVDGVTPSTYNSTVDVNRVLELLDHSDSYNAAKRNFSLVRPENRGVLKDVDTSVLEEQYRYMMDTDRYDTIEDAIDDVDYGAGWDRMKEVRETHVDATFISEFITDEFIEDRNYFTYDTDYTSGEKKVSSTDPEDVKKKMLLEHTNFGKPTIVVEDGNYNNAGELLLAHQYNGVALDHQETKDTMERIFEVWGRPINLRSITKVVEESSFDTQIVEKSAEVRYDGDGFTEETFDADHFDYLQADGVDYSTRPEDWI